LSNTWYSWQPSICSKEQYDYYEFFAGIGNLTKQARACGYKALRFDILDNVKPKDRKSNFMDLNSASGFALLDEKSGCCFFGVPNLFDILHSIFDNFGIYGFSTIELLCMEQLHVIERLVVPTLPNISKLPVPFDC
jgi:hypothetical protein